MHKFIIVSNNIVIITFLTKNLVMKDLSYV